MTTERRCKLGGAVVGGCSAGRRHQVHGSRSAGGERVAVAPICRTGTASFAVCSPFLQDLGNAFGFL